MPSTRDNVERKLRELQIPPTAIKEFTKDIFGKLERGLVDARDEGELTGMLSYSILPLQSSTLGLFSIGLMLF
jgi:hypothetical protein